MKYLYMKILLFPIKTMTKKISMYLSNQPFALFPKFRSAAPRLRRALFPIRNS